MEYNLSALENEVDMGYNFDWGALDTPRSGKSLQTQISFRLQNHLEKTQSLGTFVAEAGHNDPSSSKA